MLKVNFVGSILKINFPDVHNVSEYQNKVHARENYDHKI